jgi:hypothetical protein
MEEVLADSCHQKGTHEYGAGIRRRLGSHRSVGQRHRGGLRQRQRLFRNVDGIIEVSRIFERSGIIEHGRGRESVGSSTGLQLIANQAE